MYLYEELNELLVETFNVILKSEEKSLKTRDGVDLSISEFHLIETIAKNEPAQNTVSNVAAALGITLPSVTIAIKKLEQKGYIEKVKSPDDGRSVAIALTEKGVRINRYHQKFHMHMVSQITAELSDTEKTLLYEIILKLNKYFKKALV